MPNLLDDIAVKLTVVKKMYDVGGNDLLAVGAIVVDALTILNSPETTIIAQGKKVLDGVEKLYELRSHNAFLSRPIRRDLFIADPNQFDHAWRDAAAAINPKTHTIDDPLLDSILYTGVIAFAACYDLYKPTSRKTPGTFFEILMGVWLSAVCGLPRAKQITLPNTKYKVPTDIVLLPPDGKPVLVIPTKITTRERVVQPWAHQRILDDAFGRGRYKSVLVAASELQRDGSKGVNEICVPGQIELYQQYLAQMYGMYYLDPPAAYMTPHFVSLLPTKRISDLLRVDARALMDL